jgi:NAD(P)H-dependent FMN reductase
MNKAKILFVAGSTRTHSVNRKLLKQAVTYAQKTNTPHTVIDLKDYDLPLYNGDLEEQFGIPNKALTLKRIFEAHSGWFFVTPEYNSSIPPLLKNALDWISRKETEDEKLLSAFVGKTAAICAASPSELGGARGIYALRTMLENVFVTVIPEQLALSSAHNAFDDDNKLRSDEHNAEFKKFIYCLTTACAK